MYFALQKFLLVLIIDHHRMIERLANPSNLYYYLYLWIHHPALYS
jgi:hypothetical protein